ncbi:hypothetical protein HCC61_23925 [Streptomyces sp. HNM0575]|uniref:hypothetical protein n=1 Tax=Streptomyces sp. HNM0575 TaxID=2716338 RepID=UPI00145D255A|nr:hypothetical protein [Streptomyces sp. HNM0575]NLU75666.1 hypothetical protein [Streptomyces sp. HNM0575]
MAFTKGMPDMPRAYPPEFRARAIALVRAGKEQKQTGGIDPWQQVFVGADRLHRRYEGKVDHLPAFSGIACTLLLPRTSK